MNGAHRTKTRKLYSYPRSFGITAEPLQLMEYNYDIGKTNPNQIQDGYVMGCRGYTLSGIAGDEDNAIYQNQGTYDRLAAYEGHSIDQGGQIVDALNFAVTSGLMRTDETTEAQAQQHRRGKYYLVEKVRGLDWFDSHRLALRHAKVPISVGTIWFPEWQFTPAETGLLTSHFVFDGKWDDELGHNYKMCGEKTINGQPTLIVKPWLGRFFHFDRETFNKAYDMWGTASFIQPPFEPKDILFVKLTIMQRIVKLIARYISDTLAKKMPHYYL